MAAFPLPTLDLHIPDPLRQLFHHCESICVAACCDLDAFDVSAAQVGTWLAHEPATATAEMLGQFDRLLRSIAEHRGPVQAGEWNGCFNHTWQTPHDCLTHFVDWRRAISEAIRGMDDPPFFSPTWLSEPVVALRNAILAERAFDRLPILADALEEAGCDNRFILDHLRADDDHAHHCWVLDVLGTGGGQSMA